MAAERIEVSVIICVRNGAATIRRQLEALDAQRDAPSFEVIVVDNGSTDGTPAIVRAWIDAEGHQHVRARLVDAGRRPGIPRARNVGAGAATGRILAFCDADDVVDHDWVAAFSAAVRVDGLAGGRILAVDANGTPKPGVFGAGLIATSYLPHVGNCNCAISRNLFHAVGGYDESLPRYGFEDVDLSWRVQEAGFPLIYVDDAVVRFTLSSDAASIRKRFRLGQGRVLMARRFPEYDPQQYTVRSTATDLVGDAAHLVKTGLRTHRFERQGAARLVAGAGRVVGAIRYAGSKTPPRRLLEPVASKVQMSLAANNGEIGGGEVMLLRSAIALRQLGFDVRIIAPDSPAAMSREARRLGFSVETIPGEGRLAYMRGMRRWRRRNLRTPLWCHGLVPGLATAGLGPRILHLHSIPHGLQKVATRLAALGARRVLVPSAVAARAVPGSEVFENWTEEAQVVRRAGTAATLGYLGRVTSAKGVPDLLNALKVLRLRHVEMTALIAGSSAFEGEGDAEEIAALLGDLDACVEREGWTERGDFFSRVDLAVFPSRAAESFGLVVAEAMAAGVPFVISDAGALPEVAGEHHPWTTQAGDPMDLARVIDEALHAIKTGEHLPIAQAAHVRWEERYSPQAGLQRVRDLLAAIDQTKTTGRDR